MAEDLENSARSRTLPAAAALLLVIALGIPAGMFEKQTLDAAAQGKHKGAIARWLRAVPEFWQGKNIYRASPAGGAATSPQAASDDADGPAGGGVWLHPNMPFVVILLSPLAQLPPWATALAVNLLKIALVLAAVLMLARVAGDREHRVVLWVLALGVLWSILSIVGDIQHGNTNIFVLAAIVLHLWLQRRGRDWGAGASLALAICLKMTPALFVLYWLYQRNWKLLGGVLIALAVMAMVVPAVALGPDRAVDMTGSWLHNLIVPGLVKNSAYPIHINQSLPAMMDRFFGPAGSSGGNIWWNPDDLPNYQDLRAPAGQRQWVTLASLSPAAVKGLTRLGQLAIVALMAWAIGWRKLPRDDARRGLHFGLVVLGMMLLNQRTWDHHAAVVLVATVPLWQAIGFGRMRPAARKAALALTLLGGAVYWLTRQEILRAMARLAHYTKDNAKCWANIVEAYGGSFWLFLLLLVATAIVAIAMRDSGEPYALERQTLGSPVVGATAESARQCPSE